MATRKNESSINMRLWCLLFTLTAKGSVHCVQNFYFFLDSSHLFVFGISTLHAARTCRRGTLERMKWCWKIAKGNNIPCFGCDFLLSSFVRRAFPIYSNYAKFDFIIISIQFGWHKEPWKETEKMRARERIRISPWQNDEMKKSRWFPVFPFFPSLSPARRKPFTLSNWSNNMLI